MQNDELGFDPDALREKYRVERDKRLRPDANAQYVELKDDFAHYLEDPYVELGFTRDPLEDEVDVLIIGGGFSGLCAGARLREQGVESLRMVETGGDFGGTWYWNRYPGAQCDIESYIYLPMLEELGTMPTLKYSYGPEIQEHTRAIARHFDLYRDTCFQTHVTELRWEAESGRWWVGTSRNDRMRARYVVLAPGPLQRPKLPGIPGVETFQGHTFHTSRWDYGYTGGDTHGGLTKLSDKRVGIIGTGATAVQCVPHLGEWAQELYVFQRPPSSIDERRNRPTDPDWVKSLAPGWQQERIENFSTLTSGGLTEVDLVNDGWTDIIRNLSGMARSGKMGTSPEEIAAQAELADFQKMNQIRERVEGLIRDPEVAEALKPWYRQFCKRPCFHDDYLPTFERPNVTLVDTDGKGVERITETAVVANGTEYALDCLVFATGFEVGTDYSRRAGIRIVGREGLVLADKWKDGMSTFQGLLSNGYPNLFLMGGMQSGITPNFTELYNEQGTHIAYIVGQALERGGATFETSREAEEGWVRLIKETSYANAGFAESCTPGYYNNEGKPAEGMGLFGGNFGAGAPAFFQLLREWREKGDLEGLELR